jgi:hypothetical protein
LESRSLIGFFIMKKHILAHRRAWSKGIAIYEILGGIVALIFIYRILSNDINAGLILVLIPILGLSLASLFAGIFFFIKGNELRFYTLSKLNFCSHLLQLAVPGFKFIFYYGPFLAIGFDGDYNFVMQFETLTMNFALQIGNAEEYYVTLNLIAILPLIILRWIERNPPGKDAELEKAFMEDLPQQEQV